MSTQAAPQPPQPQSVLGDWPPAERQRSTQESRELTAQGQLAQAQADELARADAKAAVDAEAQKKLDDAAAAQDQKCQILYQQLAAKRLSVLFDQGLKIFLVSVGTYLALELLFGRKSAPVSTATVTS
jgi:hypothetical protein